MCPAVTALVASRVGAVHVRLHHRVHVVTASSAASAAQTHVTQSPVNQLSHSKVYYSNVWYVSVCVQPLNSLVVSNKYTAVELLLKDKYEWM